MVSNHLPLDGVPFRDLMSERLGLPVLVDNDSNVAVLAEQRGGAARGARDVVMLTLGTGIGGGLLLDGEVYRGSEGAGAELGHIVVDPDGPDCPGACPNHGCLEAFASGTALGRAGEEAGRANPDSPLGPRARGRARDHRRAGHGAGPRRRSRRARGASRRRAHARVSAWSRS